MIILGIETSCDETAAAILKQKNGCIQILSNVVASSASIQSKYGGIIPEQAAREQIKSIIPVIEEALIQSNLYHPSSKHHLPSSAIHPPAIDAIAVTQGPGLIGSLLVGVETAKVLAKIWHKPLIPVNHLIGHFYANFIQIPDSRFQIPKFPCIGLLVSGGHTDLVLFTGHSKYNYLGGTRDDAAGECFDKCARLLGLPYPGGPEISRLAQDGNPKAFSLPRPMMERGNFSAKGGPAYGWDFSFSGLKTAVANLVRSEDALMRASRVSEANDKAEQEGIERLRDLAASIEAAIIDVLVTKTIRAAQKYRVEQIMVAGGVAANQKLVSQLKQTIIDNRLTITLFVPPPPLCTDNAAMIAAAAFFIKPLPKSKISTLQADPNLSLAY